VAAAQLRAAALRRARAARRGQS